MVAGHPPGSKVGKIPWVSKGTKGQRRVLLHAPRSPERAGAHLTTGACSGQTGEEAEVAAPLPPPSHQHALIHRMHLPQLKRSPGSC